MTLEKQMSQTSTHAHFVAPDGTVWDGHKAYLEHIRGTKQTPSSHFVAPDGTVWGSRKDYLEYMRGK